MTDTQTNPGPAVTETPPRGLPRWVWWGAFGAALGALLIAGGSWFLFGHKVWTDGGAIRVADSDTRVRDVVWTTPQPLEGFASDEQVYEPSVSPDGTELYFVRGKAGGNARIFISLRRNNAWTKPIPVDAINGPFDSLGPRVTPDGRFLLFYSNRPGGLGGYDIWAAPRTNGGWGKPFNLGPSVNSEFNEFNPDTTPDGKHLIFATNRAAARREQKEAWRSTIRETVSSDYDLWIANRDEAAQASAALQGPAAPTTQPTDESAAVPTTRPATQPAEEASSPPLLAFRPAHEILGINTTYTEGASCMSPAGDFLYFSSNRPGGLGKFDIYRSRVRGEQFGPVENVGLPINSAENEADPALAYNGFRMVFSSDRPGADGRYHLLASDSREVYSERQGHPLPHLGWSWWLLLVSLLVLVPLLLFLRGWEDHRLSILQRCLLMSLLVHAIITFILSFVVVTQKVTQYVRQQMQMEVAVNLNEAQGIEEGLAIRSQSSGGGSDLPVSAPPGATLQRAAAPPELTAAPAPAQVNLPAGARVQPAGMVLPVEAADPPAQAHAAAVQPNALGASSDLANLKPTSFQPVSQTETVPGVHVAQLQLAKASGPETPQPQRAQFNPNPALPEPIAGGSPAASVPPLAPRDHDELVSRTGAPEPGSVAGSIEAPQVHGAMAAARTSAAEPSLGASSGPASLGQGPLQAAAILGPPAAGPGKIDAPAGPVARNAKPTDLTVAAGEGAHLPGHAGTAVGAGTSPAAPAAAVVRGPQLAGAAPGTAAARAQAVEPAVASAGSAGGALTRTATSASAEAGVPGAPPRMDVKLGSAAPSTRPAVELAANPAPAQGVASSVRAGAVQPDVNVMASSGDSPVKGAAPDAGARLAETSAPSDAGEGVAVAAIPARQPSSSSEGLDGPSQLGGGKPPTAAATGASTLDAAVAPAFSAIAPAALAGPRSPQGLPGDIADPRVGQPATAIPGGKVALADPGNEKSTGTHAAAAANRLKGDAYDVGSPVGIDLKAAPVRPAVRISQREKGSGVADVSPGPDQVASATISPDLSLDPLGTLHGPGNAAAPETPFMRAPAQRQPLLKKFGGTKQSEDAVDRGLAYLARMQESDGRWTRVEDDRPHADRPRNPHDMACTGFAVLAFLAHNERPDKPGSYHDTVASAIDYLISQQDEDGDLRGAREFRGGGSDAANMYDQGIATYALAECAIMTHDPRITEAALKGARFIVAAQDRNSGGWRYSPNEFGDSSVFGWQIMALHSAEQVGFEIPQETIDGAKRYIESCGEGRHGLLAGYQPHSGPTPAMTAEILFCRMLLDMPLDEDSIDEATRFLAREPPDRRNVNLYYWYYASLSMLHMQDRLWKDWNILTRESLISTQHKTGASAGCWDNDHQWGARGGRVFTTAMATLTLEVYYRYLPLRKNVEGQQETDRRPAE